MSKKNFVAFCSLIQESNQKQTDLIELTYHIRILIGLYYYIWSRVITYQFWSQDASSRTHESSEALSFEEPRWGHRLIFMGHSCDHVKVKPNPIDATWEHKLWRWSRCRTNLRTSASLSTLTTLHFSHAFLSHILPFILMSPPDVTTRDQFLLSLHMLHRHIPFNRFSEPPHVQAGVLPGGVGIIDMGQHLKWFSFAST